MGFTLGMPCLEEANIVKIPSEKFSGKDVLVVCLENSSVNFEFSERF